MLPILKTGRDLVLIESREAYGRELKAGDAVLFTRGDRLVLHRILEVRGGEGTGGGLPMHVICGDNQFTPELVADGRVIGIMTGFVHDGLETRVDDPAYQKYVDKIMHRSMGMRKIICYGRVLKRKLGIK